MGIVATLAYFRNQPMTFLSNSPNNKDRVLYKSKQLKKLPLLLFAPGKTVLRKLASKATMGNSLSQKRWVLLIVSGLGWDGGVRRIFFFGGGGAKTKTGEKSTGTEG